MFAPFIIIDSYLSRARQYVFPARHRVRFFITLK